MRAGTPEAAVWVATLWHGTPPYPLRNCPVPDSHIRIALVTGKAPTAQRPGDAACKSGSLQNVGGTVRNHEAHRQTGTTAQYVRPCGARAPVLSPNDDPNPRQSW